MKIKEDNKEKRFEGSSVKKKKEGKKQTLNDVIIF